MGEKSWRAEMPVVVRREASSAPELCFPSDVRELVTRANAELDAKDARIAELQRELDETQATARSHILVTRRLLAATTLKKEGK